MSTLLDVKKRLVYTTGRFDLVTDVSGGDWTPNSDDFSIHDLINDAQKFLDRLMPNDKTTMWYYTTLSAGDFLVNFQKLRYVKSVYVSNSTVGELEVERKSFPWMQDKYDKVPVTDESQGTPAYWCPIPVSPATPHYTANIEGVTQANPAVVTVTGHNFANGDVIYIAGVSGMTELNGNTYTVANVATNTFELSGTDSSAYTAWSSGGTVTIFPSSVSNFDQLVFGEGHYGTKGIILGPPADSTFTLSILGAWFNPTLTKDTDYSFWTVEEPALLARCAAMLLEIDYQRNTAGYQDLRTLLQEEVFMIYRDVAGEAMAGEPKYWTMRG